MPSASPGIVASVVLGVVLLAIDAPQIARAIVIFPLWGAIVSLEQARRKFCAAFAFAGIRSVERIGCHRIRWPVRPTSRSIERPPGGSSPTAASSPLAITALFVLLPV